MLCIYAFPQVVNKRCARNYALSFEGPESPQRPERACWKVKPLLQTPTAERIPGYSARKVSYKALAMPRP